MVLYYVKKRERVWVIMKKIWLKEITQEDLKPLWEISYGPNADLTWMEFNGPYFQDPVLNWQEFSTGWGKDSVNHPHRKLIMAEKQLVGMVTAYWEDGQLKQWLETGITIYDPADWGNGIGSAALKLWCHELFDRYPYLPHLGFTTWSGNLGMQKVGEKIGMQKEGVIRKVRFWQNQYFDSVKYGILRDELEKI